MKKTLITLVFAVFPLGAQDPVLALKDAVRLALDKNKSVEASVAARNAAEMRVSQARSGLSRHTEHLLTVVWKQGSRLAERNC